MITPTWMPPRRILLLSCALVVVTIVLVGAGLLLVSPGFAQAVYLGLVVSSTTVRALGIKGQIWAGLWIGTVCALGTATAGDTVALYVAIAVVSLGQIVFTVASVGAMALSPAMLVFYALFAQEQSPLEIGLGTWAGAAVVIGGALLLKMPHQVRPVPVRAAVLHGVALAIGCVVLMGVSQAWGVPRANWALLAFCLVFLPQGNSPRVVAEYLAGTALGAVAAVALGLVAPEPLVVAIVLAGAVLTVAFALVPHQLPYMLCLTPTVLLLASLSAEESVLALSAQRTGLALLAGVVAMVIVTVWQGCAWWRGDPAVGERT